MFGLTLASGILMSAVVFMATSLGASARLMARSQQKLIAEQYASELLEYFVSFSTDDMKAYHATNPVTRTNAPNLLYPLCAAINLKNRSTGTTLILMNPDPRVALPSSGTMDRNF